MSYGVFRPPPHLRRPAPPRQRLPLGALSAPPQTVNLGLLSATGALQATTVAQTTYLGPLSATAALLTATDSTTGGGQTENLGLLSAASALRNTQVNQTTYLGALSATAAALTPTVTPGAVSQNLALQSAASALGNTTVTPGGVSVPLGLLTATGALQNATATTSTIVNLGTLSLAAELRTANVAITVAIAVAANADDGYLDGSGNPYASAAYSSTDMTSNEAYVYRTWSGGNYFIGNALFRFDTSSLGSTATVLNATLRLAISRDSDTDSRSLTFDWHTWTPTPGASNWTATAGTNAHAGTAISTFTSSGSAYYELALSNVSNINKTGYTGLRGHLSGGQPTAQNQVGIAAIEDTTYDEPRLLVTYIPGTTGVTENLAALSATAAMPAPTVTGGPTSTTLSLQTATAVLRTATVTPGPVVLQLLTKPLQAGDTTYTVDQLKFRTLDELQSDNTSLAAALRNTTTTSGVLVQLGVLSATGALRNTTVTPGPTSTPLALQTLAAALQSVTVQSITNVPLGLLTAAGALRNTTVTIGGVTTPLETLALALVLRDLDTGLGVTPTVVLALQSVPEATLVLETVASATVGVESVPSATVGVEAGPTAQIDDEDVPTATVALAP